MRRAIGKHWRDFAAIVGLCVIGLAVGGYILSNQRFYLPKWVPVLGSDFVDYEAEFSTAQSVTPGQGQTVNVAGVPVGEISKVRLQDGRAVVTMKIRRKFTPVYRDATALLRPKTGLNDMVIELAPGSKAAGELDPGKQRVPVQRTLPNINADEVLSALDDDTRQYLQLLVGGAGEALKGNARNLSATFRRFEPTGRDLAALTEQLAERRLNIKRSIGNFSKLTRAVGAKDQDLARLVDSSNAVFRAFSNQDDRLRAALGLLPGSLEATNTALAKADKLARELRPTLRDLRPAARALAPSLRRTRPFLRETEPVVRTQLRPFSREALPTVKSLRPAARDLAALTPNLLNSLQIVNSLLNTLAYNPPGDADEGYLFWQSWVNHLGGTIFNTQDAHGPVRRGLIVIGCSGLATLDQIKRVNDNLATLIDLLNPVLRSQVCAQSAQPGASGGTSRAKKAK